MLYPTFGVGTLLPAPGAMSRSFSRSPHHPSIPAFAPGRVCGSTCMMDCLSPLYRWASTPPILLWRISRAKNAPRALLSCSDHLTRNICKYSLPLFPPSSCRTFRLFVLFRLTVRRLRSPYRTCTSFHNHISHLDPPFSAPHLRPLKHLVKRGCV